MNEFENILRVCLTKVDSRKLPEINDSTVASSLIG